MSTPQTTGGFFSHLKSDFPSGIVVFLVALPLCLGIALASGAPLFSGLIAGIVGGTVVALLSGSPLGVSGPAAGLAVIVLGAIQELGFEIFLSAVVLAGFIQIGLGLLRAGVIGYYFPSSVIKGMLSGIGSIIILKQIPRVFGDDNDPEGDFAFAQIDGLNTLTEFLQIPAEFTLAAVIISVVSLAILILYEQPFMKRQSFTKIIQGPLVVVVLGIILGQLLPSSGMPLAANHYVEIPVADSFDSFLGQFTFPDFSGIFTGAIWITAITLAVVASLETLLCVEATDKLDPEKRITPTNRELLAQGVGNSLSGLIGGLPVTQVIVRSSANIQSGGKTKAAAFIHGILLLVSIVTIPNLLNQIPLASLAAILLLVGYKLAKPAVFRQVLAQGKSQFIPYIVTILGIVFTDLLVGIAMGVVVAIVQILWNNYSRPYHFDPDTYRPGETINIRLSEDVSFLNKAGIMNTLDKIPENSHVIIDGTHARTIHPDIIEIIENFEEKAENRNIRLETIGIEHTPAFNSVSPERSFSEVVIQGRPGEGKR